MSKSNTVRIPWHEVKLKNSVQEDWRWYYLYIQKNFCGYKTWILYKKDRSLTILQIEEKKLNHVSIITKIETDKYFYIKPIKK